ncbi:MAG: PEP-CTERM sorting domain-containing protein [Candidatus Acidiferrales bacterium]
MKSLTNGQQMLRRGLLGLAVSALAVSLFGTVASADTTMTLTGVGDQATVGNVYVDPYTATIAGFTNVPVICDDWSNNTYQGEQWKTMVMSASTVSNPALGTPMFGNNQTLYNEIAYLASNIWVNPTDKTIQTEYSFALWELTYGANGTYKDPTDPLAYLAANLSGGTTNSEYAATVAALNYAKTYEANYNSTGWIVLNPEVNTSTPSSDGTPQEFLTYVNTPEPSTLLLLALGLGGLLLLSHRKKNAEVLAA